ncbi:MAG: hypothetical protein IJ250_03980, partial [Bacteroidales bacterium]|nr:hypothetical protein [Bacteroidales bacterium]
FLPNDALVAKKAGFFTQKKWFFHSKNLLFSLLFSESAKFISLSAVFFSKTNHSNSTSKSLR